jgi:hypothetical protein
MRNVWSVIFENFKERTANAFCVLQYAPAWREHNDTHAIYYTNDTKSGVGKRRDEG